MEESSQSEEETRAKPYNYVGVGGGVPVNPLTSWHKNEGARQKEKYDPALTHRSAAKVWQGASPHPSMLHLPLCPAVAPETSVLLEKDSFHRAAWGSSNTGNSIWIPTFCIWHTDLATAFKHYKNRVGIYL